MTISSLRATAVACPQSTLAISGPEPMRNIDQSGSLAGRTHQTEPNSWEKTMQLRNLSLLASVSCRRHPRRRPDCHALAQAAAALTGTVSSAEEGNMEGVLVSAKKEGSTITVTVVTDDKGHYSFPADRLTPGKYTITIRAVGYDARRAEVGRCRGRRRQGRHQARQDQEPRQAALQRGMADQRAGPRQASRTTCCGCTSCHTFSASSPRRTTPTSSCRCSSAWAPIRPARRRRIRSRCCRDRAANVAPIAQKRRCGRRRNGSPAST